MLWKIADTPHRLLGSVHILPPRFAVPDWATASYDGVRRIVFEADHRDPTIGAVGFDPTGTHLDNPGVSAAYELAADLAASVGRTEPFDGLRPWRAAFHLVSCLLPTLGLYHEHGMDNQLRIHADTHGLEIAFLEVPTRAFDLLDSSCEHAVGGLAFLEHVISTALSGAARAELLRIIRAWLGSDQGDFTVLHAEKVAQFPFMFDPLITQRNREWLSIAQHFLSTDTPTLIVVGSLHTVGPGSFIEQLESVGYRLIPHSTAGSFTDPETSLKAPPLPSHYH